MVLARPAVDVQLLAFGLISASQTIIGAVLDTSEAMFVKASSLAKRRWASTLRGNALPANHLFLGC